MPTNMAFLLKRLKLSFLMRMRDLCLIQDIHKMKTDS